MTFSPHEALVQPNLPSLSRVLTSAAAVLKVPGFQNELQLPAARSVCVALVDGLGSAQLKRALAHMPFLRTVLADPAADRRSLQSAFPSTTTASLASLGTGLESGLHGMVGYEVLDPDRDTVINLLGDWDPAVNPLRWQPYPTVFEQLQGKVRTVTVSLPRFKDSPLTRAVLRGSEFLAATTPQARVRVAAETLASREPTLLYWYWSEVDKAGHRYGVDSPQWEHQVAELDGALRSLSAQLPPDTLLLLTADHGMVDVAPEHRYDFSTDPALVAGVRHTAGEPRLRQLYLEPDADAEALVQAWRKAWGHQAWILQRDEAIEAGFYGEMRPEVLPRIGQVLVAAREPVAFYDMRSSPARALELVGQHGSLTKAERVVPLIRIPTGKSPGRASASRRR
ncbi:alkaline phosphatase family protein [Psychromicrobium xiongbiense]|uniref:alkaline phosphatase family protein n=1 Tax=Psychromicrobium xiongbiense TaxID=3051184 RepID=UPI0025549AEF|nr:alkaline phosphatase family protein [Psychromicrobium sp. YIM S02556]